MIGARDMAFPRLNAFGFWMLLFGGFLLYFSYIGGSGLSGAGSGARRRLVRLCSAQRAAPFRAAHSTDYWILGILVGGFGSIATAINIIVTTIFSLRCPGMTLSNMPLLVVAAI